MGTLTAALTNLFKTPQTSASYVPLVTSAGAPAGNISTANLASVLGGLPKLEPSTAPDTFAGVGALNKNCTLSTPSTYINNGKWEDMPVRTFGHLITINLFSNSYIQIFIPDSSATIYYLTFNGGSQTLNAWRKIVGSLL